MRGPTKHAHHGALKSRMSMAPCTIDVLNCLRSVPITEKSMNFHKFSSNKPLLYITFSYICMHLIHNMAKNVENKNTNSTIGIGIRYRRKRFTNQHCWMGDLCAKSY